MKEAFRFSVLSLTFLIAFSSQAQLDSLLNELEKTQHDTLRLDLLNKVAFEYRTKEIDSTFYYGRIALALAKSVNSKKWINRSMYNVGVGFHIKGDFDSAIHYYQEAIPLAEEDTDEQGLSRLYNNLGLIDLNRSDLRTALANFLHSYELDVKLNDSIGIVRSINNIGLVHQRLGEWKFALDYFIRAEAILLDFKNDFRLSQLYNNIGLVYKQLGKLDSSRFFYERSITYLENPDQNCYGAHPTLGIADLLNELDPTSYDSIIYYGSRALKISSQCGLPVIQSSSLLLLGEAYFNKGDTQKARERYQEALNISRREGIDGNTRDAYQLFYQYYKKAGALDQALAYLEKYETLKSSIVNQDKVREITQLEAKYEANQERQKLIATQENERILLEQEIQRQKERRNFYLVFAIVFLLVICLLFIIYRKARATSMTLKRKNELINELSGFKNELINMIAHDIKNPLNSIISLAGKLGRKEGSDISKAGESILHLVTNMLDVEKFESTSPNLALEHILISDPISEACLAVELLCHDKSIKLITKFDQDVMVKADRDIMIRVFVNLLSNAIKFSPSNEKIEVLVVKEEMDNRPFVKVSIVDKGRGISYEDQPYLFDKFYQAETRKSGMTSSTGLGLSFCKMAMLAQQGFIGVLSSPGKGSTFWILMEALEVRDPKRSESLAEEDVSIPHEEMKLLKTYSIKLKGLKVYNVGAITPILDEIETLKLQSDWVEQVRTAVQHSNKEQYQQLIGMFD